MLTVLISKACIFDWAGTVCDAGVFAPVLTFQKLFEDEGVPITSQEVREPMGVHKRVSEYDYTILYYTILNTVLKWCWLLCAVFFLCPPIQPTQAEQLFGNATLII